MDYYRSADPDEITQAVVALARATFSIGGRLVFGGHPSISPLVMMIAEEYVPLDLEERRRASPVAVIYQSAVFRGVVSPATTRMAKQLLAQIVWTRVSKLERQAAEASVDPRDFPLSLKAMRTAMLGREDLVGAVFIGGMDGIVEEAELFRAMHRRRRCFFVGAPGGAAKVLAERELIHATDVDSDEGEWLRELATSREYPALMQRVLGELATKRHRKG